MIGKFCIVRTYSAGVHFGKLAFFSGMQVRLERARRLWSWKGAKSLHEIALRGVDLEQSKISDEVEEITLTQAIEIIPGTTEAEKNLRKGKWK